MPKFLNRNELNLEIDYAKKEDAKAAIHLANKRKGKVSLYELSKILQEIMGQAEGQYREWPVAG